MDGSQQYLESSYTAVCHDMKLSLLSVQTVKNDLNSAPIKGTFPNWHWPIENEEACHKEVFEELKLISTKAKCPFLNQDYYSWCCKNMWHKATATKNMKISGTIEWNLSNCATTTFCTAYKKEPRFPRHLRKVSWTWRALLAFCIQQKVEFLLEYIQNGLSGKPNKAIRPSNEKVCRLTVPSYFQWKTLINIAAWKRHKNL